MWCELWLFPPVACLIGYILNHFILSFPPGQTHNSTSHLISKYFQSVWSFCTLKLPSKAIHWGIQICQLKWNMGTVKAQEKLSLYLAGRNTFENICRLFSAQIVFLLHILPFTAACPLLNFSLVPFTSFSSCKVRACQTDFMLSWLLEIKSQS